MLLVNTNVVQYILKSKKDLALELRRKGFSYSEIRKVITIPKSTLSSWIKGLKLDKIQIEKLKNKRIETARTNSQNRILKTAKMIEEIGDSSARDVKEISKKELWLMGIVLYWRERFLENNRTDINKGVRFTSSDPGLIKLFLKWLKDAGRIKNEEIAFDIFVKEDKKNLVDEVIGYWAHVTSFPRQYFSHVYFQKHILKRGQKKEKTRVYKKTQFGLLRVRIKASSMLARQIAGWIKGIQRYYWGE